MENTTQPCNWQELLLAAGYLPTQLTPTTFRLEGETDKNQYDLYKVLHDNAIPCVFGYETLTISAPAPTLESWLQMLDKYPVHNSEGESMQGIHLRCLEVPMRAMMRQFHRLGIKTRFSCSGHPNYTPPNTFPCVGFCHHQDLTKATALFTAYNLPRIPNKRWGNLHWFFNATPETLVEFGIKLNTLNTIEEGMMEKRNSEELLLTMLLNLPGESGEEELVRQFLLPQLTSRLDTAWQDEAGNLLGLRTFGNGPTVLLAAHMDVVAALAPGSQIVKEDFLWRRSEGILGADDRAGIAMVLLLLDDLQVHGFAGTIKVVFTVHEEDGQLGAMALDPSFYQDVKMAISLDRKNGGDIIIRSALGKKYGPEQLGRLFETASSELWQGAHNYTITDGGISDLRVWSAKGVPSLNLSVGFHDEHKHTESLNLNEWRGTRQLVLHVLTTKNINNLNFSQGDNNGWL